MDRFALFGRRLVYDCENLAVGLTRGDTLPGPGKTAVFTATDRLGPGDSHRGAVAASLVEALRSPAAANLDFSIVSTQPKATPCSLPIPEHTAQKEMRMHPNANEGASPSLQR